MTLPCASNLCANYVPNYGLAGDDPKLATADAIALWLCGKCPDLETGIATVQEYLRQGLVADKLTQGRQCQRLIN